MNKPIVSSTTSIKIEKDGVQLDLELDGKNCCFTIDEIGVGSQHKMYAYINLDYQELKLLAESILSELNKSNGFGKVVTRGIGENAE